MIARRLSLKRKRHLSGDEEQEVPTKVARKKTAETSYALLMDAEINLLK